MTDLEIHAYNVGFGDAILICIPRDERQEDDPPFWTILIDGGNAYNKEGGDDGVLLSAMQRIHEKTGGIVDLYIMTHEHMDHVQGPLLLHRKDGKRLRAERVWMTASAHPDYYEDHPEARKKLQLAEELMAVIETQKPMLSMANRSYLDMVLALNNPRRTSDCVDHIREKIPKGRSKVRYIHANRSSRYLRDGHGIGDVEIEVWAPEEDTSVYYGRFRALTMAAAAGAGGVPSKPANPTPPAGVAMSDFYRLVKSRESGFVGNALMIDKAGNNSSIVFLLKWKGRRLLFAADAEERSWQHIHQHVELERVDFLKVSHHGSGNGTPRDLLDPLLGPAGAGHRTKVLVSTADDQYPGVPDDALMAELKNRCDLYDTRDAELGKALTITIPPV